eukprot:gene1327-1249_t
MNPPVSWWPGSTWGPGLLVTATLVCATGIADHSAAAERPAFRPAPGLPLLSRPVVLARAQHTGRAVRRRLVGQSVCLTRRRRRMGTSWLQAQGSPKNFVISGVPVTAL